MLDVFNSLKKEALENVEKVITPDTIIGSILDMEPAIAPLFMSIGMHCLGCPSSRGETVEQACAVHGVDCEELLEKLNAFLASRK